MVVSHKLLGVHLTQTLVALDVDGGIGLAAGTP